MHDVRGVIRRQRNDIKFYVTGEFIYEKAQQPGVIIEPPIYLKTTPITTTRSRPIEQSLVNMYEILAFMSSSDCSMGTNNKISCRHQCRRRYV